MSEIIRFGVSLEKDLLQRFDRLIREKRYTSRSEAIRDLIRQEMIKKEWEEGGQVAGAITFIYDHHKRNLLNRIMDLQHDYNKIIVSTQHIHLDHNNCLEVVAVRGTAGEVLELADALKALKGVRHGTLSMTGVEKDTG
ncbi:MAG TPA: nickel-responsive transcriptional regulator NikR [Syntrophales bacterium]|nr:nickel-responsive transcriptional regulator NikR [Syntrophales bacterium]HOM06614.1 nickel-responsive transcriptional regulator NikR [Syntrophales bacterium]HON99764.1 nickel-responsive transcriptional regulator NikR [Syntrophales bacterium]HPC01118.1 nickel-responsive transcriptional regulator NikR [Syntrophales bacterium]HPQ06275.1 nickel-responsive transcriptional regulator NikR [Syntrophales bacterium]